MVNWATEVGTANARILRCEGAAGIVSEYSAKPVQCTRALGCSEARQITFGKQGAKERLPDALVIGRVAELVEIGVAASPAG
jgi:hypothetical protein